jgi:hypothetical protein
MPLRSLEVVRPEVLTEALARTPAHHHVVWTGRELEGRAGSLRSRSLRCVIEAGAPVPLRVLLQRAANLEGGEGYDPDTVRSAVRLHQTAKPAVYLLVERLASGDYVAVTDIPFAGSLTRRVRAGEVLLDRRGVLQLELAVLAAE